MFSSYISLFRQYWPMLCFGLLTVFWGNYGQSFFISWFGASIQQQLNLSATAYGSAYSGATLVSGLSILILGGLIDRVNIRRFVLLASTGLSIAALLMWQVSGLYSLMLAFFMLRFFGQGLLPHTAVTTMAKYFSFNRGKALSIASNGVPFGEVVLPSLAVMLIAILGWQQVWLMVAASIPVIYVPLALWLLRRAGPSEADLEKAPTSAAMALDGSRRTVLTDSRFWFALPLILMPPFAVTGIFIHQGFILTQKHWNPELFALSFAIYGGVHWISSTVVGDLVDRFTAARLLRLMGLPFAVALGLSGLMDGDWVALFMMALMGVGISMMGPVIGSLWAEVYGTRHLGSIRSLVTALSVLSTSVSPALLGYLIDAGMTADHLLLGLGTYGMVGSLLCFFSYRAPASD